VKEVQLISLKKFLVDNAETMRDHWFSAKYLLETLLLKLNAAVEFQRIELNFTIGHVRVLDKTKIDEFSNAMEDRSVAPRTGMYTDMRASLTEIFTNYIAEFKQKGPLDSEVRGFTLFVLTDYVWAANPNKVEVKRVIDRVTTKSGMLIGDLKDRPVSIEFIQFGTDKDAIHRLQELGVIKLERDFPGIL
jgi:hypothetical protein